MNRLLNVRRFLSLRTTFWVLCAIYLVIIFINIYTYNDILRGGDYFTYLYYTKGFQKGLYTYWYFLDEYLPDTFRNPGFSLIIYSLSFISESVLMVVALNLVAFLAAVYLLLKIIDKLEITRDYTIKNLLLFFLILNAHIPQYINLFFPEVIMFFLIVLIVYLDLHLSKKKVSTYIILGLLYGITFQVRPVILFYPFIKLLLDIFIQKRNFRLAENVLLVIVYVMTMLPYGYWNYKTHGIFNITPIEGGGGVMFLSYWSFKTPNYTETRYWRNTSIKGLISFTPEKDVPQNIKAFNKEWDFIDSSCAKYLTEKDKRNLPIMNQHLNLFKTFNGRYTSERERLLVKLAVQHFLNDPVFTLKIKTYTLFRMWVTGVKADIFHNKNIRELFLGIGPAVVSGFTLLLALIFIPLSMIRRRFNYPLLIPMLILVLYYGMIHLPFALQARYTIPVRPLLMLLTSICIFELYFRKEKIE